MRGLDGNFYGTTAYGGTNNQGTVEINPRATMNRDASILGMSLANVAAADLARIHAALVAGFEQIYAGQLKYTPAIKAMFTRMIRYSSNPDASMAIQLEFVDDAL
jgi:hypothetical protein